MGTAWRAQGLIPPTSGDHGGLFGVHDLMVIEDDQVLREGIEADGKDDGQQRYPGKMSCFALAQTAQDI
jgi:hypothetical protein